MKNKTFIYFLILLVLDLGSKLLMESIAPNNSIFKLSHNPNLAMGIEGSDFVKFVLPLIFCPILFLFINNMGFTNSQKPIVISLFLSGMVGNYVARFNELGVVDFINCHFFICNLADIYMWVGMGFYFIYSYQNRKTNTQTVS